MDSSAETSEGASPPSRPRPQRVSLMRRLRNHFITGIAVTAPIGITIYLVWQFVGLVDGLISGLVPAQALPQTYLPVAVPGFGVIVAVVFLTLVGAMAPNFLGRWVVATGDRIVGRMPVVRSVYGTLKKIFDTVLAQSSKSFREVVLVEYPRKGVWALAFVTGTTEGEIQTRAELEIVNVFLPTTPNPTSGFLLFLPRADVVTLHMSVEEGIKMVISGGLMTPPERPPPGQAGRIAAPERAPRRRRGEATR